MTPKHDELAALTPLLALALRLEDEGQYNLAKLARAAADALGRRAAYRHNAEAQSGLLSEIERLTEIVSEWEWAEGFGSAFRQGAAALTEERIPLIHDTPPPFVCRTCGHATLHQPAAPCPTCGAWPDTYQRFMPNYWFDALEPLAALSMLRQTPAEVETLLDGLTEETMNRSPQEGGWAIRNVVTHLRDAQNVFAYRLDLFLTEENPLLEMKAVWTWAANEEERPPTSAEIFKAYRASRTETLAKLENMPLEYWWRVGRHEEFGEVTLRQQASYFAAHERTHLPQIAALRLS